MNAFLENPELPQAGSGMTWGTQRNAAIHKKKLWQILSQSNDCSFEDTTGAKVALLKELLK